MKLLAYICGINNINHLIIHNLIIKAMAHRYNERNIGLLNLEGSIKNRKSKTKKISQDEIDFIKLVLERVYNSIEYDKQLSNNGHLHPDSVWTDGGRFTISLTGAQKDMLSDILYDRKF